MRKDALDMVYEHACADARVVFVGSDLGPGVLDNFRQEMPERFFMEGVSEAAIVGLAAGLAAAGSIVYVNTIAVFLTRRVYEQVALDVCLRNLDVRLIGNGGGLVYAPLGPTHMATDDLGLMRALPNMRVVAPADAPEMRRLMRGLRGQQGPAYIRVGKGNEPEVTRATDALFGMAAVYGTGGEVLIATTGITLHAGLAAVDSLAARGVDTRIVHLPVVKPLDTASLAAQLREATGLVVVEEHAPSGGLHSAIAEWLVAHDELRPVRVRRIGLPDAFPDRYGSQQELLDYYGVNAPAIVDAVLRLHEDA